MFSGDFCALKAFFASWPSEVGTGSREETIAEQKDMVPLSTVFCYRTKS